MAVDAGQLGGHGRAGGDAGLDVSLPATVDSLVVLRQTLATWLDGTGTPAALRDDLVLAAHEVAANAVEHAYHGRAPGHVRLQAGIDVAGGVRIEVQDDGRWRPPHPAGDRGRGLRVAARLVTTMEVHRGDDATSDGPNDPPPAGRSEPGTRVVLRVAGRHDGGS